MNPRVTMKSIPQIISAILLFFTVVSVTACASRRPLTTDLVAGGVTYSFQTGHYRAEVGEDGNVEFDGHRVDLRVIDGAILRDGEVVDTVRPGDRVHLTNHGQVAVNRVQPIE